MSRWETAAGTDITLSRTGLAPVDREIQANAASVFGFLSDIFIILRCAKFFYTTRVHRVTFSRVYAVTGRSKKITAFMITLACARFVARLLVFSLSPHNYNSMGEWMYTVSEWMVTSTPYPQSTTKCLTCVFR